LKRDDLESEQRLFFVLLIWNFMNIFKHKKQRGFSLIELLLVLGIMFALAVIYVRSQTQERNLTMAKNVGKQGTLIGAAMNVYIVNRYATISALTSAPGTAADPGPRTCNAGTGTCTITLATLVADGLLPTGFTALPPFTDYNLTLRRTGVSPNFNIDGLAISANGWTDGAAVKYDMVGEAIRAAGPDAGMTFQSTTVLSGYQGAWTEAAANYPTINALGQFGVRSGSGASMFSQFLRRDGTLPMTGGLNMGGNDITNANNISTGTGGCKRTELTATGQVYSRDGGCVSRFQNDPNTGQMSLNNAAGTQTYNVDSNTGNDSSAGTVTTYTSNWHTTNGAGRLHIAAGGNETLYLQPWSNNGETVVGGGGGAGNLRVTGDIYLKGSNTPLSVMLPEYSLKGVQVVYNWSWVTKPSCGSTGGVGKIVVTPSIMTARIYAGGGFFYGENGFVAKALDYGSGWYVNLSGWPWNTATQVGLAHIYCDFRFAG
jgi:prepilin-type N-terminal cleavage/methylation domain-containing protein